MTIYMCVYIYIKSSISTDSYILEKGKRSNTQKWRMKQGLHEWARNEI